MTLVSGCDGVAAGSRRTDAHHSDSLGVDHDLRRDGGEVGQVCQDVDHRDDGHGYDDGQRQVPAGGRVKGRDRLRVNVSTCTAVQGCYLSGLIISSVT